jgi:hypothetical protein
MLGMKGLLNVHVEAQPHVRLKDVGQGESFCPTYRLQKISTRKFHFLVIGWAFSLDGEPSYG